MKLIHLHSTLVLLVAGLCLSSGQATAASAAMTIGDLVVSGCERDWRFAQKLPRAVFHRSVDGERKKELRREVDQEIEEEALLALEARRLGVKIDLAELDARYIEALKKAGGQERVKKFLAGCGLKPDALRASLRRGLEADALVQQKSQLSASELDRRARARYQQRRTDYVMPASLHLWQAIAKTDPSRIKASRVEALPRAQEIAARMAAGDSLDRLRQAFAGDSFKDMGWVHEAALEKKYRQKFLALEIGQVSEPLPSIYGYNIFKLIEKRPPQQLDYEQIAQAIRVKLQERYRQQRRAELLEQGRKRHKIKRGPPS